MDRYFKDHQREARIFFWRLVVAAVVVLLLLGLLLWRYYLLQVVRHQDFVTRSENNRVHVRPIPPTRGLIYDRNGVLLADNRPGFSLSIVEERAGDLDTLFGELGRLIALQEEEIQRFRRLLKYRKPYEAVPLRENLTEREQGILAVNEYRLPGVEVSAQLVRYYPQGELLSHVVGYVGRINEREIQVLDPVRYRGTHSIGKTGLEKYYEDRLMGQVGYEFVETNARGRIMRVLERIDPLPGKDLHLSLDIRLQQVAYQALAGERGAVVALEPNTGNVLAMVSAPGFNPNLFVTGISHADYRALLESPDRPLFDRALQGQYPPGSTVKPLFGVAALDSGLITPAFTIYDPGFFQLDKQGRKYRDWNWKRGGHGSKISLHDAIVQSCDVFFYDVGSRMGIDLMHRYGNLFGLGKQTGIDLPSERSGIMPSREWKLGAKGLAWYPGDTVNASIGQGFVLVTPLQLATATARLASKGIITTPRLRQAVQEEPAKPAIPVGNATWDYVLGAMADVVHGARGTAKGIAKGLSYRMGGKTGTAQVISIHENEEYDEEEIEKSQWDHALFIAFAPVENPAIALGIIVENGQHGSSMAAPVARKVIDAYIKYQRSDVQHPTQLGATHGPH